MTGILTTLGLGKIQAIVGLVLILTIAGLIWNTNRLGNKVDGLNREIGACNTAHEVTASSLEASLGREAETMRLARERHERAEQAAEDARQARIRHEAEREALRGRVASLQGLIRERDGSCPADDELLDQLEGM